MPRKAAIYRPAHRKTVRPPDQRPSAARRGYGRGWQKLRLVVLAEEPVCQDCERAEAEHVDHVDGNAKNLLRANLRSLCSRCHGKKTVERDGGFGRPKKGRN